MTPTPKPNALRQSERWMKPPPGQLKQNCDVSFMQETAMGAWGFVIVIRDLDGYVVSSGRGKVNHLLGAFQD